MKIIHHRNGETENRAMICYETEMEGQRAITEINRYKGWRAEKQFNERRNTSSREKENEENDREKTINQE